MEITHLHVKLSPKLKAQFEAVCKEREISMSDAVRDLIANSVRNYTRKNAKPASENLANS